MKADAEYAGLGVYIFRFLLIDRVSCGFCLLRCHKSPAFCIT